VVTGGDPFGRQLLERPDVVEDPERPAVRRDDKVVVPRMDHHRVHRDARQVGVER
jgi:hypothetical protein